MTDRQTSQVGLTVETSDGTRQVSIVGLTAETSDGVSQISFIGLMVDYSEPKARPFAWAQIIG